MKTTTFPQWDTEESGSLKLTPDTVLMLNIRHPLSVLNAATGDSIQTRHLLHFYQGFSMTNKYRGPQFRLLYFTAFHNDLYYFL